MYSMSWFEIPQGIVLFLASPQVVLEPEHTIWFLKQKFHKDLNDFGLCIWA